MCTMGENSSDGADRLRKTVGMYGQDLHTSCSCREEKDFRSVRSAVSLEKETHVHVGSYELDLAVAAEIHLGVSVVVVAVAVGRFVGVGVGRWFVIDNPRLDQFYFISVPIWLFNGCCLFPRPLALSTHSTKERVGQSQGIALLSFRDRMSRNGIDLTSLFAHKYILQGFSVNYP